MNEDAGNHMTPCGSKELKPAVEQLDDSSDTGSTSTLAFLRLPATEAPITSETPSFCPRLKSHLSSLPSLLCLAPIHPIRSGIIPPLVPSRPDPVIQGPQRNPTSSDISSFDVSSRGTSVLRRRRGGGQSSG